ncbi:FABP family protein [Corynebacterium sp. HS2168-gen11]|uniref:FABP family protein n=1 Tax=Corynebacterium sp. HS2168-gen11 TaxID=2974027 RepID=UPI00216B310A|nr:FABP family protein [Corynebacterium sp. HS2168-gen11]MCS4536055.1 FABP family protein [Corynebacterium sp. HS2168-gen11]
MTEQQPISLSGSEAVDRAAEQWKESAHRNIPGLGDLPVVDDTANLREGPNLHDGLLALLPLVGVWRGTGQAIDDNGDAYSFGQQLIFAHDGENYLTYESRTWRIADNGEVAELGERETGFWRINLQDEIEVVAALSSGAVEIFYGNPMNERAWQLESASTMVTATGPAALGAGKRLYGLMPNNNLGWVDERLINGELTPRMSAELTRVIG